jgi:hypothetical protein
MVRRMHASILIARTILYPASPMTLDNIDDFSMSLQKG